MRRSVASALIAASILAATPVAANALSAAGITSTHRNDRDDRDEVKQSCDPGAIAVRTLESGLTIPGFSVSTTKDMSRQKGCSRGYLWVKIAYRDSAARQAYAVLPVADYTGSKSRSLTFTAHDFYPTVATASAHLARRTTITTALTGPWMIESVDVGNAAVLLTGQSSPSGF